MRRFRQGEAPVILYSRRGVKLFDFGLNRVIETDDEDLCNLLLAMGAVEMPPVIPAVPQDLSEVAARINALDGRVVVVEGRADIRSVGDGLALSGAGELSATGTGSGGGFVAWNDITGKPADLATTDDVDAKVFLAEYNVTTAQEIIDYLNSEAEPFAPIIVKRGSDYYTAALATKSGDDSVIVRVMGSGGGDYIIFNYTVRGASWSSASHTFQKKLISGTDIKTINGQSLLGGGNIDIGGAGAPQYQLCDNDTGGNVIQKGEIVIGGVTYGLFEFYYKTGLLPAANATVAYSLANLLASYTIKDFIDATGMTDDGIFIGNGRTDNDNRLIVQQFSKNSKTVTIRAYKDFSAKTATLKVQFIGTKS